MNDETTIEKLRDQRRRIETALIEDQRLPENHPARKATIRAVIHHLAACERAGVEL